MAAMSALVICLGLCSTARAGPTPVGVFFLQGVGSAPVNFFGTGCAAGIAGSNVAQINDMDATITAPDGAGNSNVSMFVAWADPSTNGSASGNFKYKFAGGFISQAGFVAGNGVVSNAIPVEGTGVSPTIPISGSFTGGTIDVPSALDPIVFNSLAFIANISLNCDVTVQMNGILGLIAETGTEDQPSSGLIQAQQLGRFGQTVQTFIPKVVARPGSPRAPAPTPTQETALDSLGDEIALAPLRNGALLSAAGDDLAYPVGIWASYQTSRFEDSFAATASDSDSDVLFAGIDFSPWEGALLGLALGYESTETDTRFNTGQQDLAGFNVIPYFGMVIDDYPGFDFDLSTDLAFGFSSLGLEQFRTDPGTGARVNSETDSFRAFVSWNVSAARAYGDWYFGTRAGFLLAKDTQEAFTESNGTQIAESNAKLGRVSVGADASYLWNSFEPFANVLYEYDYEFAEIQVAGTPHPNDRDDFLIGAGLRWYSDYGITSSFEYSRVIGREEFDSETYNMSIR